MQETRKELIHANEYLKKRLEQSWDSIDLLNAYINQLCDQIRAMGGTPVKPEKE